MFQISKRVTATALTSVFSLSAVFIPTTFVDRPNSTKNSAAIAANRPTTMAINGMVTTPHYLASQAALDTLKQGGNAVDAAITAASTLAVVYPHMNSIGGDNFWLIYNAKTRELKALNASGRAGEKVSIDFYKSKNYQKIPQRGYLAANTVPGAVSGWGEAYKYAQQSMGNSLPWSQLLNPAISYAQNGTPVTPSQEYWTKLNISVDKKDKDSRDLHRIPSFKQTYLKLNGESYKAGEIFKQPQLAKTLMTIAQKGDVGFYQGEIAQNIVKDLQAHGGLLTLNDFAKHTANWVEPISVDYRQYKAYNFPPNTQGMASLEILNILNNFNLKKMGEGTADYYHTIVEATKLAFADRDKYLSDPSFVKIPLDLLLSRQYRQKLAAQVDMKVAVKQDKALDPKGDTVWLGVVDKDGNAVSLIQSIYHDYGSGIVAGNTGVLLQNRGSFFSLDPKHINRLEPRKRTFHTLNPAMLFKDAKPYLYQFNMKLHRIALPI